jgi:hypothetical protein
VSVSVGRGVLVGVSVGDGVGVSEGVSVFVGVAVGRIGVNDGSCVGKTIVGALLVRGSVAATVGTRDVGCVVGSVVGLSVSVGEASSAAALVASVCRDAFSVEGGVSLPRVDSSTTAPAITSNTIKTPTIVATRAPPPLD